MSEAIVRAIDVGYGNTKFVQFHTPGGEIACSLFPSISPQASTGADLTGGVFQRRNTVIVEVNGVRYEVGRDAKLAQDASYGRTLDADFSMTDAYMALVRGAISYMGVPHLDHLILGLPVNTHAQHHEALTKRMVGVHRIPDASGNPIDVEVRSVTVTPQPIGAFFDYTIRNNVYGRMRNQTNLLIDPGYYTLDWVVAHGVKMVNARSGAHSGGMSSILSTIGESVSKELGHQLSDFSAIDEAIRTGVPPRFFGKARDITEHIRLGKEKARQFVSVLANKVGNGGVDIDNIIIAGGGAEFFRDVIQEKFPNHELVITEDPVFANVRGFQLAGEQYMRSRSFNSARVAA